MRRPFSYAGSFLLIGTLIVFFGFHTIAGERGLIARGGLDREILMAQEDLALINKQNNLMEAVFVCCAQGQLMPICWPKQPVQNWGSIPKMMS